MLDGASPQPRLFAEAPRTRSALLAARRAESTNELQARYDQWEACNPAWAQRLTGPAAAAALGKVRGGSYETHDAIVDAGVAFS